MRILCHAQHLSGVGHWVRMHAIARGLSVAHAVHLVDGGRPMPRPGGLHEPELVGLPRLARTEGRLAPLETSAPVAEVLAERARILAHAVKRIRPDAVLIDHYPFSKWELEPEIAAAIEAARRANPGVRIFCSLRDIVPRTRYEDARPEVYDEHVLSRLHARFDAVLVHADPTFTRLEEHFDRAADLRLPVYHTGFVIEPPPPAAEAPPAEPYAVLSCGGGTRHRAFLLAAIEAFRRLRSRGAIGSIPLHVFPGPFPDDAEIRALRAATRDGPVQLRAFSADFARWLAASALSISLAGYNTTAQLLASGMRSVVIPDPEMSDQGPRARRLAELGLATVVEPAPDPVEAIAAAVEAALARPRPRHGLDLGGIAATRVIIETLGAAGEAGRARPRPASTSG